MDKWLCGTNIDHIHTFKRPKVVKFVFVFLFDNQLSAVLVVEALPNSNNAQRKKSTHPSVCDSNLIQHFLHTLV